MTRQGLEIRRLVRARRCPRCRVPVGGLGVHCPACRELVRVDNRNRYRRKHGIPLDAPLRPVGRTRIEQEAA